MMGKWRIGVVIKTQHLHAEDQHLYRGVRDYSQEHGGFAFVLAPFAAAEMQACRSADKKPYDGLLAQATAALVTVAQRLDIPIVDVERNSRVTVPINCVFPDFAKAGRMVGQHLASCGYQNFGYIVNRGSQTQAAMCDETFLLDGDQLGFADYIKARGYRCVRLVAPGIVHASAAVWHRWSRTIRNWIHRQPKPLGLFVPNDMLCRHIADIASELGLKIPLDLGLICADNDPNFCLLDSPSLTAIDLNYRRVGYEAAAMLDRMLTIRSHGAREILFIDTPTLLARNSTDATTFADPLISRAVQFIRRHADEPIKVMDVAQGCYTTRRTLERHFRRTLGYGIMHEITRCRIEKLKRRLSGEDTPIKRLVASSGFNSARVLYETFVREEGMPPTAYRNKRRRSRT